ncbi:hypothetical protein BC941DRAFT_433343 [Chlamydoabsidia padenii]|nr:hypothetical protein BC941DRAFT_433343 [Chlamydoabsidia padenii]
MGNSNDTLFLPTDDTTTKPSTSDSTVTITTNINNPNYYQHHHHRSSSLLHSWLKRGRYIKKNYFSLWPLCGLFLLTGYIYLYKSPVQKRHGYQSIIRLTQITGETYSVVSSWCKKAFTWMDYLWSGLPQQQREEEELSVDLAETVWFNDLDDAPKLRNTKFTHTKGKDQHTRTTKPSGTQQKHHSKKNKKQQQQQQQQQRPAANIKCQSGISYKPSYGLSTIDAVEQGHVDKNDWINVGDKKKKDMNTVQQPQEQQHSITYNDQHCIKNDKDTNIKMDTDDFDDDDKTVVDDGDLLKLHTTPTTSDDEAELNSPGTSTTHHHHYFHHHHYHCHDHHHHHHHHHLEPVIRNWYSPFSTGLDIDILPARYDPLTLLDPMQLRKQQDTDNNDYYSRPYTVTPPSYQPFYDNFSLLQNHPFIGNQHHHEQLQQQQQQSTTTSLPLGAIGQHSPSSSPVKTSKQRTYSLFI